MAIDAIDPVLSLKARGSHVREPLMNQQIDCRHYAYEEGIELPEIVNWKWPRIGARAVATILSASDR